MACGNIEHAMQEELDRDIAISDREYHKRHFPKLWAQIKNDESLWKRCEHILDNPMYKGVMMYHVLNHRKRVVAEKHKLKFGKHVVRKFPIDLD